MIGFIQKTGDSQSLTSHKIQCFYGVLNEPQSKEEIEEEKALAQKEKEAPKIKTSADDDDIGDGNID